MLDSDFTHLMKMRMDDYWFLSTSKGQEYARNNDRLHNFRMQARMGLKDGESPESALWGDLRKHLASIMDIINDLDEGRLPTEMALGEKFNDYHVYGHLLEALIVERLDHRQIAVEELDKDLTNVGKRLKQAAVNGLKKKKK